MMKVLVGCEYSGVVRDAFLAQGHDAWSCDLKECPTGGQHIQGNVLEYLREGWDLAIFHPPCTYLARCGGRYFKMAYRQRRQEEALRFVKKLMDAPIRRICIENPVGVISTRIRKPDQIIQPWMFGHPETKATCLWLNNLPKLEPICIIPEEQRVARVHLQPDTKWQAELRSLTYPGVALAMASQWGPLGPHRGPGRKPKLRNR